jgi:hypothetical protein
MGWASFYNNAEDLLFHMTPGLVADFLFTVPASRQMKIKDPLLGVTEKVLIGLILAYVIGQVSESEEHLLQEIPTGIPTVSFLRKAPHDNAFNDERNANANGGPWKSSTTPYCSSDYNLKSQYEYLPPLYKDGKVYSPVKNPSGFFEPARVADGRFIGSVFNDNNIKCKQIHYAELINKDLFTASLVTFQTETISTVHSCSTLKAQGGCSHPSVRESASSTIISKYSGEDEFVMVEDSEGQTSCTCLEKMNYFPLAPEYIGLQIYHQYQGTEVMNRISGSTNVPGTASNVAPVTYVKRRARPGDLIDMDEALRKRLETPFQPGQPIELSLRELLLIAGTSLDTSVPQDSIPLRDDERQPAPMRRTTGVQLNVEFEYDVNVDTKQAVCTMYVSFVDGLTSWSKDVQMHTRQTFDQPKKQSEGGLPSTMRQYSEFVNRGVLVTFSTKGKIKKFDLYKLVNVIVQGAVLIPMATVFVLLIAQLGPRGKVYGAALKEKLEFTKEMAKAGAMSALVTSQVKHWEAEGIAKRGPDGVVKIPRSQLKKLYQTVMSAQDAENLCMNVFETLDKADAKVAHDSENISIDELTNLLTGDVINMKAMPTTASARRQRKLSQKSGASVRPEAQTQEAQQQQAAARQQQAQAQAAQQQAVQQAAQQQQQQQQAQAAQQQQQHAQQQQQQQQARMFAVQVPANVLGGQIIQVQAPLGLMNVTVPAGLGPGQTFHVQY